MISDKNFNKAEKKLEEILRKEEEDKRAKEEAENARREACCSEIQNRNDTFLKTPNDLTATSLLNALNEYCPDDEIMADNYLTTKNIHKICADSLMVMVYDTVINVAQAHREDAKAFLVRFAPELNSEKSFNRFKNDFVENACKKFKSCADGFLNTSKNTTAESLLNALNEYCPNDEDRTENWLTKDRVAPICGKALQKMAFDTTTDVTPAHRENAKSFLDRFAPELNSNEAYAQVIKEAEEAKAKKDAEEAKTKKEAEAAKTRTKIDTILAIILIVIVSFLWIKECG